MKYRKHEAKDYSRVHMRGIFAAANTPFRPGDLALDEAGLRANMRHWINDLAIDGLFVAGKQGEFFSLTLAERKRLFDIAVEETAGKAQTVLSCSDQNLDVVIELARHAEAIGGDYIIVHAPMLHFHHAHDDCVREYYRYIASQVSIGIALWSHPDSGYLLSPELCAELAGIENVVAIKYSVPREMYVKLTQLAGDKFLVSTASEEEWFDNIVELGWQLYLCSSPPYTLQTALDRRMREYTDLAMAGNVKEGKRVRDSLNPVREAIRKTRPPGKPFAHQKYWQELLGQVGGPVRRPLLELSEAEKAATRAAFETCWLTLTDKPRVVAAE
jgi:4-hydroxy-tetrahydrodipicolinate synthase